MPPDDGQRQGRDRHVQRIRVGTSETPLPPRAPRRPRTTIDPSLRDDEALEADGLRDLELTDVDLANRRGLRVLIERVRLRSCRLTGIQLAESTLRDLVVEDSRVDLAAFRMSTLERVVFRDCQLQELDLMEAKLDSVVFEACDLTGADISHATFRRSLVRNCALDGLVGADRLRGVSMPWPDIVGLAGSFAAALGVSVIEDDETEA